MRLTVGGGDAAAAGGGDAAESRRWRCGCSNVESVLRSSRPFEPR